MERYRRAPGGRRKKEEKTDFKTKLARQTIASLVILGIVMVIGAFKTETANLVSNRIQSSLSYTVDYKEAVKDIMSAVNNLTKGNEANDVEKAITTD